MASSDPVDPGFDLVKPTFGGFYGRNTYGAGGGLGGGYATPGNPLSGPNGTAGSGTNTNGAPPPPTETDWADSFWGSLGVPSSLVAQINQTIGRYTDASQALAVGQQILRTSDWYRQTFPGIAYGIQHGLFTDETGYRDYVNRLNNLYQQYAGRAITGDEVSGYLQSGRDAAYVGNVLQGNAIAQTEGPQSQYLAGAFTSQGRLSDQELQAYGQEKAGIDTPLGQQVALRLQQAQQRMQKIFEGTLAKPGMTIGPAGVYSPFLQGARENTATPSGTTNLPS